MKKVLFVMLGLITGCTHSDGAFLYTTSGRVVDSSHRPLPDRRIIVSFSATERFPSESDTTSKTDADGRFTDELMTGLAWGGAKLFGVIPLYNTNPKAPPVTSLFVAVERAPGDWVQQEVHPNTDKSANTNRVQLGDVVVDP